MQDMRLFTEHRATAAAGRTAAALHHLLRGVRSGRGIVDFVDYGRGRGLLVKVHEGPQLAVSRHHLGGRVVWRRLRPLERKKANTVENKLND